MSGVALARVANALSCNTLLRTYCPSWPARFADVDPSWGPGSQLWWASDAQWSLSMCASDPRNLPLELEADRGRTKTVWSWRAVVKQLGESFVMECWRWRVLHKEIDPNSSYTDACCLEVQGLSFRLVWYWWSWPTVVGTPHLSSLSFLVRSSGQSLPCFFRLIIVSCATGAILIEWDHAPGLLLATLLDQKAAFEVARRVIETTSRTARRSWNLGKLGHKVEGCRGSASWVQTQVMAIILFIHSNDAKGIQRSKGMLLNGLHPKSTEPLLPGSEPLLWDPAGGESQSAWARSAQKSQKVVL